MNIPPFPAQDLAKLVLGYLAEEQLMTAYDEFLSASPYLDALRNEYDRIFMTSLKNILAEYRAVKIYVETCKPYSLRRWLFGCTNLLEIVKFLVQNVDVSKLQVPEGNRGSLDTHNSCAVCQSLKLSSCACKGRHSLQPANTHSADEVISLETSVETTPLEDLPGNITTKKKHMKTLPKQSRISQSFLTSDSNTDVNDGNDFPSTCDHTPNESQNLPTRLPGNNAGIHSNSVLAQSSTVQNVEQINPYCSDTTVHHRSNNNCTENIIAHRVSTAGTFQDFTSGVKDGQNINANVPDSSTSENVSSQPISSKEKSLDIPMNNAKPVTKVSKAHIFLTVGTIKTTATPKSTDGYTENNPTSNHTTNLRSKSNESKVTILSDIKVDKAFSNEGMPAILKNATSTPLMHMQTILINGTPVYKPKPSVMGANRNFTKDEIMAMPTIIVVPTTGASQVPPNNQPEIALPSTKPSTSSISTTAPSLEPLVIDVPTNSPALPYNTNNSMPLIDQQKENESEMLVKTVDTKMVSAPRDGGEPTTKHTPQVAPPARKSSSTPRRISHVRVLDFATPRRILQEPLRENAAEDSDAPVEVVLSRSPSLHTLGVPTNTDYTIVKSEDKINKVADNTANSSESTKENEKSVQTPSTKKINWDAGLRALAITNKKEDIPKSNIQPRCRPRSKINKSKSSPSVKKGKQKGTNKGTSTKSRNESINKTKSANSKRKTDEIVDEPIIVVDDNSNVPVKPTINIITGQDWSIQENEKNQNNKSNNSDLADTPEMDRLSLQNAIGAKLNISDLLETPYKQVLYDIQMETPRFLGPDLPDVPMSDIKIMNIPTPRFLDTPKPLQATPSSYSSRPTDYSSGGSYYKPDDQDYIPAGDLDYSVSSKEKNISDTLNVEGSVKEKSSKSKSGAKSRPVRKCAKNVSYYHNQVNKSTKESEDKSERVSTCKDTMNVSNSIENKIDKEPGSKTVKESKSKTKTNSISKKYKSPVKRDTSKTFMKIKPRRVTPIKESVKGKVKSKKSEGQPRKRTTSKEKTDVTPVALSVPTKSRRKSSTPRKLHCTKQYNTESSGHDSPEMASKAKNAIDQQARLVTVPDSDTEQVPLHWSDDGSQDTKPNEEKKTNLSTNETEDISKIKEYIASECVNVAVKSNDASSNDLIKIGFDRETAKIIERDLLDSPADSKETDSTSLPPVANKTNKVDADLEKTMESDTSAVLKIVQEEEEECDEIEFGVFECNEDSENYITCNHDDLKDMPRALAMNLKEKFSMEVCIDDGVTVRLRVTPMTTLLDEDPHDLMVCNAKETEMACNSISNTLYTPVKDRDIVYDIFESTLTSLDTPLKVNSPKRKECDTTVTEIILEVEKMDDKERPEDKKRKRLHSSESNDSTNSSKRKKPDAQYLLNSADIQNIDIETVLSKLHGP